MKCTVCTQFQSMPTHEGVDIIQKVKATGYPIHTVCISEYFEKIGQKGMDLLCHTFNSAHFGYVMNLIASDTMDKDTRPTEAPPVVVWVNSNQEGSMFLLDDSDKDSDIHEQLYTGLKKVPSEAYSMVINAHMKSMDSEKVFRDLETTELDFAKLSKSQQLKRMKDVFGEPKDLPNYLEKQDAVIIQGQTIEQDFMFRAIARIENHNGVKYLKPFSISDISHEADNDIQAIKDEVEASFSSDAINYVSEKFKDYNVDDDIDNTPLF